MIALIFVSILWAFSFGLIKGQLTGIDPSLVAFIRLALCALVFLPFFRATLSASKTMKLVILGSLQFGVMYWAYIQSYQYLPGYLVAVFTIFTPLYVMLFSALLFDKLKVRHWLPVALSILGTAVIVFKHPQGDTWITGIVILQLANIVFAFGQVSYKYIELEGSSHLSNIAIMYIGGALLSGAAVAIGGGYQDIAQISQHQWMVLCYLGIIASGIGFCAWNYGAKQVSPQNLAIMNNGYVPLAVIFALTIFGESADIIRLTIGSVIIAASLWWSHNVSQHQKSE